MMGSPVKAATNGNSKAGSSIGISLYSHVKYEHLVAGISGGVASTIILHPLDLIKIRFAVNNGQVQSRPQYRGVVNAFDSIVKQEGLKGLYRGVTPNVWGAGASWGLYFLFYNAIKGYKEKAGHVTLGAGEHMLASAEAGFLTLVITNPLWVVKTRLCLQFSTVQELAIEKQYRGMLDTLYKVYRYEGIRGLYKGFFPGTLGVSHGALQIMAYEELKKIYCRYKEMPEKTKLGTLEYLVFAALSKLFAASATYPYQVVRARLQDQHSVYTGVVDVVVRTWRFEGISGLYKGVVPYLCHVTPSVCIVFLLYECMASSLTNS